MVCQQHAGDLRRCSRVRFSATKRLRAVLAVAALLAFALDAEAKFIFDPSNSSDNPHETLEKGVTVFHNVHWYNGSFHTALLSGPRELDYHGVKIRSQRELPALDTINVDALHSEKSVLIVGKPFWLRTWHSNVFDEAVPVFRVLKEMGLWDDEDLRQYVSVYFANDPGWDSSHTGRTLRELLELHIPHVFLDKDAFERNNSRLMHATHWAKVVFLGTDVRPDWHAPHADDDYRATYLELRHKTMERVVEAGHWDPANTLQGKARVLLVQREQNTRRSFVNDSHVLDALDALSDKIFYRAQTCRSFFFDQFNAFANADVVVLAHGACASNLLWMKAGAAIVEIFPYSWQSDLYRNMAAALDLRYYSVMSTPTSREHFPQSFYCDPQEEGAMTEEECLHTKDFARAPCCGHFVRDQRIIVDPDVLQAQVANAANPEHRPACCEVPFGPNNKLFNCA